MHQRINVAERQQVIFGLEPENFEHGLRPEDAAARKIPIPQPAAAAVERGIDAAADSFVDHVCFPRPRRLPVKGKAEDQHDETGGGRERDGQRGQRAPRRERGVARLHDGELAERGIEHAHGGERAVVVGQRDFHDAGAGAEGGERLRRPEQVDQAAADGGVAWRGVAAVTTPSALVSRKRRPAPVAQDGSACGEHFLRPLDRIVRVASSGCSRRSAARSATASSDAAIVGKRLRGGGRAPARAAPTQMVARKAMIRTGTARRSSGSAVSSRRYAGLAIDCARPLIESGCADALATSGARHKRPPFGISPATLEPEGCAASLSESVVDWNRWPLICRESEELNI